MLLVMGQAVSPSAPKVIRSAGWKLKGVLEILVMKTIDSLWDEFGANDGEEEGTLV